MPSICYLSQCACEKHSPQLAPDWKVYSARAISRLRSFDVLYIYSIKFCQSHLHILQTFQSGTDQLNVSHFEYFH